MVKKNEWVEFFDGHAPAYMSNPFTRDTIKEIDFLTEELSLSPKNRILDIGCGTGRHSIELARRGYQVTGVDVSSGMLTEAKRAAEEAGVVVEWIHSDATKFRSKKLFDAAICLCEGAFALLTVDDDPAAHDLAILRNINASLKRGGRFVLTTLNGFAKIRKHDQKDVENGTFDPFTLVEILAAEWDTPQGKRSVLVRERGYLPQQLAAMLSETGFRVDGIWGGTTGNWGRRRIEVDEIEIMVVATKT
jgi:2-polyprenyl-3-methyl-5-hydroxy-6-metoxy-1,4-benzoquinol methylase